jgi:anti-sigma-K factor RskA
MNREELASLYVLDRLAPDERTAFEAHMLQDPGLLSLVRDFEAALAARVNALPTAEAPPRVLQAIEEQIDRSPSLVIAPQARRAEAVDVVARFEKPPARFALRWAAIGAVAALIMAGLLYFLANRLRPSPSVGATIVVVALDNRDSRRAEMPLRAASTNPDARFIQLASLAERFWERPDALPVKPAVAGGRGYAVFDPATEQGFIAVQHIPPLQAAQRYHLWAIDRASRQVRDAGVLPLTGASGGLFFFSMHNVEPGSDRTANFFVTVEDEGAGAPATPRGKVVLGRNPI